MFLLSLPKRVEVREKEAITHDVIARLKGEFQRNFFEIIFI